MGKSATLTDIRRSSANPLNSPALTRRTSLCLPADFSLAEWKRFGKHLFLISDSSCWWLGDWLVYGQKRYPGRYRQTMEETGLEYKTLRNYAWIARRFPAAERHPEVSFQHHAEVASLEPAERATWLQRAAREGWSRNALRQHVRQALTGPEEEERQQRVRLQVQVSSEQESRWATAAERNGSNLAEWIVLCLDRAADLEAASGG
jgi:hypothetical protein